MVATPWGDSEKLKARRLSPGPGTSPQAVAENQRARIFGAMVASVAELGYGATRVADLSDLSGVSSRSFYGLFPGGKDECFMDVLDQILEGTLKALTAAGEGEEDWKRRLQIIYTRFADIVAAQPAAASLVLTEAYAAGPAATEALDRATSAFERLSRRRLKESSQGGTFPTTMIEAQVGALQELARTRLRRGEADLLHALVPELVDLVAGYQAPPERLRMQTRRSSVESESVPSLDEAERAIQGFILAVAEHGYAGATIQQIARQSGMSPNTFYANFRDKRTALLAAIDSSTAQLEALAMAAYRRSPGWAGGVRAMIGSALNFLASRPATANILLVEVYAGGPEALRVRGRGVRGLTKVLGEKAHDKPEVPKIAPEVIAGGLVAMARRQLMRKGARSLTSLAPIATYIALAPYVGPVEACAAANGDGRARMAATQETTSSMAPARHTKWTIQAMLGTRWATADELAGEIGVSKKRVLADLEDLEKDGVVERIVPLDETKPTEWANTKIFRLIEGEDWASLTPEERRDFTRSFTRTAIADLVGLEEEALGRRLDEHYTHLKLELDEEGWTEVAAIHRAAFDASQIAKAKSEKRIREVGGPVIPGRSVQVLFELPPKD